MVFGKIWVLDRSSKNAEFTIGQLWDVLKNTSSTFENFLLEL